MKRQLDGATLDEQVFEFHEACGQDTALRPCVPGRETMQLRLRLVAEEFFELLAAAGCLADLAHGFVNAAIVQVDVTHFDMVEVVDALADIDYVVTGFRLAMGVDGKPIADEVHRSNMAKCVGGKVVKSETGKILKGADWTPPDIAAVLKAQGWDK